MQSNNILVNSYKIKIKVKLKIKMCRPELHYAVQPAHLIMKCADNYAKHTLSINTADAS